MSSDWYNYEVDLDDYNTRLDFGKFKGMTPVEVAELGSDGCNWLVWCWKTTQRWCGSEDFIKKVFREAEVDFVPRKPPEVKLDNPSIEDFESAIIDAYGTFPKPLWMNW